MKYARITNGVQTMTTQKIESEVSKLNNDINEFAKKIISERYAEQAKIIGHFTEVLKELKELLAG